MSSPEDAKRGAERLLRQALGPDAAFRDGQWEAIHAIVVASSPDKGGTRAGALDNLNPNHRWGPLLVRSELGRPSGNDDLIRRGGLPLDLSAVPPETKLDTWLREQVEERAPLRDGSDDANGTTSGVADQLTLFDGG